MINTLAGLISVLFYTTGVVFQRRNLTGGSTRETPVLVVGTLAVITHFISLLLLIPGPEGYDFSFFKVASLFSWVIAVLVLVSSLKKPLHNLFIGLFPLAIVCILATLILPDSYDPQGDYSVGVAVHILLGILSVSIITIGACQALLISFLDKLLKNKQSFSLVAHLPPLVTMEALLFEIIWLGLLLLTGVIITGILFMDDFFGQHLSHKTVLSIISWVVFSVLLWGRHQLGWRGRTANRWILTGFAFLILAYFGSKFVLEIVLERV